MKPKAVGIICEFNPFHNGHKYFIEKVKEMYPDHVIVLMLNGYFMQRGEVSILSKESKTKIALEHGIDLVIDHNIFYGTQSADNFAEAAIRCFDSANIDVIVFGSECNDKDKLYKIAKRQLTDNEFDLMVKKYHRTGISYPAAISKALEDENFSFTPNDILGICYVKAIIKNNFNIDFNTIKRTNDFHDNNLDSDIVSASNIRNKLLNNKDVAKYIPDGVEKYINTIDFDKLFAIIKMKILSNKDFVNCLDVDAGMRRRLIRSALETKNLPEFIERIKVKNYTYTKLNRMLIHIIFGITKQDSKTVKHDYYRVLGFNITGRKYLNKSKKVAFISHHTDKDSPLYHYEVRAAALYELLTGENVYRFEYCDKPIKYYDNSFK